MKVIIKYNNLNNISISNTIIKIPKSNALLEIEKYLIW